MLKNVVKSEERLLAAALSIVILLNVPFGNYVLYPFMLFSTWVHEMCHALAALSVGGTVVQVKIFENGSGVAFTSRPDTLVNNAFIASAGYLGTAVVGAVLLALRRIKNMERISTVGTGVVMILTALLWIRNGFGFVAVLAIGATLVFLGSQLKKEAARFLFSLLAATCSLNSLTSIRVLFSIPGTAQVGGQPMHSDAHSVSELLFLPHWFWAGLWLAISVALLVLGLRAGSRRGAEGA